MFTRLIGISLFLVTFAGASFARPARAQEWTGPHTFVAIPESFPEIDARAVLVREPGIDLVVLPAENANTDALAMALLVLRDMRARHPTPSNGQVVPLTGYVVTHAPTGTSLQVLQGALTRLQAAEVTDLGSLGPGRRVRLFGR